MFYSITCPYCRFPIQPLEECVICTHCRRVQHKQCWEANRKCASEGCTGEPEPWRRDGASASEPPPSNRWVGASWLGVPPGRYATVAAPARRHVRTWPVAVALAGLIVWALYQCLMLAHESGRFGHASADSDLRLVSGRVALLRYPRPTAPVLAELPAHSEVKLLSIAKDYVRVQASSGQIGYVPRNRLDLPPPRKKPS